MSTFYEQPGTGIRVAVNNEYAFSADSVDVTLARKLSNGDVEIMRRGGEHAHLIEWERVSVGAAVTEPTFRIPTEFAHALLDALLQHFQGASDMHQLRQDFLHERGRVDRLFKTISDIATVNAQPNWTRSSNA